MNVINISSNPNGLKMVCSPARFILFIPWLNAAIFPSHSAACSFYLLLIFYIGDRNRFELNSFCQYSDSFVKRFNVKSSLECWIFFVEVVVVVVVVVAYLLYLFVCLVMVITDSVDRKHLHFTCLLWYMSKSICVCAHHV